ncbi:MAG: diguanylate cyclase [Lachnospiraceae bacterium]|nr:diguanylate cyclase [Lachnospiraceae bacterium]
MAAKGKEEKVKRKKNSLYYVLLRANILSVFVLALVIVIFSANRFADSMHEEVKIGLVDLSATITTLYDQLYPGDFTTVWQEDGLYLLKGGQQLNGNFEIIDEIKEKTGVDITITYQDTRVITTLFNTSGERLVGTRVGAAVKKTVFEQGTPMFYPEVKIEDVEYFAYYAPLTNSDGTAVGMIFVAKPSKQVKELVRNAVLPIFAIGILGMVIVGWFTIRFSNGLIETIEKIKTFLEKISKGNLRAELPGDVLARQDELGDMGQHVVKMQKSLRELIEQDLLTGLNNRRSGEKKLRQVQTENTRTGLPFCIAIGDIDYFKRVNDTYGHECGDVVLANISARLKRHMKGNGFAVRWGGEEFLLVFDRCNKEKAVGCLEDLMQEIRAAKIQYGEDTVVQVTMTFGIEDGSADNIDHIIRSADEKLYFGKNNGRNQIVQ